MAIGKNLYSWVDETDVIVDSFLPRKAQMIRNVRLHYQFPDRCARANLILTFLGCGDGAIVIGRFYSGGRTHGLILRKRK